MRFLKITSTGSYSLTEDLDEIPTHYAVLSHTWGEKRDEVTYGDIIGGTEKDKDGYKKVSFGVRQAQADKIDYFWVDTCCIDKTNATELGEAITSMFRWYKEAARCYVYLSDVSVDQDVQPCTRGSWEPAFRSSRWFKRGWTLQELVAPTWIGFFSAEGKMLGTKQSLGTLISEITGIPLAALQGAPMDKFSVRERFQWTRNRETRKEEDGAYCLLGIFGVFMPLIYGEGKRAYARLKEEITKASLMQQSTEGFPDTSAIVEDNVLLSPHRAVAGKSVAHPFLADMRGEDFGPCISKTTPEQPRNLSVYGNDLLPYMLPFDHGVDKKAIALKKLAGKSRKYAREHLHEYCTGFTKYDYGKTLSFRRGVGVADSWTWFKSHVHFCRWSSPAVERIEGPPRSLWVTGSTGTGKSILAAYAIETLQKMQPPSLNSRILVLYSLYEAETNETSSQMICVLIHQILEQLPELRDPIYLRDTATFGHHRQHWERPTTHLWPLLRGLLAHALHYVRTIFIVLDEVYRLDAQSQNDFIRQLYSCKGNVRLLIFWTPSFAQDSSDSIHLAKATSNETVLDLEDDLCAIQGINYALDCNVIAELQSGAFEKFSDTAKRQICGYFRQSAGHNFLTACLTLAWLSTVQSEDTNQIMAQLSSFPLDVGEIYTTLLDRLRPTGDAIISDILNALMTSFESFTLAEMTAVINWYQNDFGHSLSQDYLLSILTNCYPLIVLRGETKRVQFWHRSARSFLFTHRCVLQPQDPFSTNIQFNHQRLASMCLSIMMPMKDLTWPPERLFYGNILQPIFATRLLSEYAFRNWYQHLHAASRSGTLSVLSSELVGCVKSFSGLWMQSGTEAFRRVVMSIGKVPDVQDYTRILHRFELFCGLGLTMFVKAALDRKVQSGNSLAARKRLKSALAFSIKHGHTETAQMLITRYNITSLNGPAYKGLLAATVRYGAPELTDLILRNRKRDLMEVSEAHGAALSTGNWQIYQTLSKAEVFQDQGKLGDTVLHALFSKVTEPTWDTDLSVAARVEMLVKLQGINPNAKEQSMGNTALHLACWNKYGPAAVSALIAAGADPLCQNKYGWTPLHLCARYGVPETMELLIQKGGTALMEKLTRGGCSALHWATQTMSAETPIDSSGSLIPYQLEPSTERRIQCVRLLLENGANPLLMNAREELAGGKLLSGLSGQTLLRSVQTSGKIESGAARSQLQESNSGSEQSAGGWEPSPLVTSDSDSDIFGCTAYSQNSLPRKEPLPAAIAGTIAID